MTGPDLHGTEIVDLVTLQARGRVGTTLRGKWRLDCLLGVGGMAAVYAATHRNGHRAAVKILHAELALNAEVKTRFLREGYVANTVAHEGVVKVIDDDTAEDGSLFMCSELLDGETLEERRVRLGGRLSEDDVLSVTDTILDVLIAAHQKGVIHRDLKPENVFATRDGRIKVLDFGIARLRELSTVSTATRTGTAMGTPAFMPPEQARGLWEEVDGRTDLWAVGATMFTLLTGKLVHDGRTANEQLLSAMTKPAPELASVVPGVAPAIAHLVDRALAFDREKRWPTAQRMQEAGRHAYHNRFGRPITTIPGQLKVPASVVNRTLASDDEESTRVAPRLPTTNQPVAGPAPAAQAGSAPGSVGQRPFPRVGVVVAGFGALLLVLGGISLVSAIHRGDDARAGATSSTVAPMIPPQPSQAVAPAWTAEVVPSPPPTSSASTSTRLPSVPARAQAAPPSTGLETSPSGPASPAAPPSTPPAPKASVGRPGCNPPFIVVGGKKKWKEECL